MNSDRLAEKLWFPPPAEAVLPDDEVHVWRASLNVATVQLQGLLDLLAPDETRRAERFYFQEDRNRFIVARGVLRIILSRYLDMRPDDLRFHTNRYGKPALDCARKHGEWLSFNLSHSGELALYAVARGRGVGVDLERIRPHIAGEEIAARFFSPRENAALRTVPPEQRHAAFFTCWTRKEAYIKARGEGLSYPLDQFDVSLHPGEPARLLSAAGDPAEAGRWSVRELRPGPDYMAALVVEGHGWKLKRWQMVLR
ncbi:MAG: 4'-phosphopantetheinyl transferase superfamily protein [Ardenticatenaceae bacterium]|nr:4'-phosphopantetheinyl transferase superfamily protein [Ardenticatenaceae bacterium]